MKKLFYALIVACFLSGTVFAQGLITGETKYKYKSGNKVLFMTDFHQCPVGEIPEGFDKVTGTPECVRYENKIWFAANVNNAGLIKKVNLGEDEFSVDFDLMFLKGNCQGIVLRFYAGHKPGEEKIPYEVGIGPGCSGEAIYAGTEKVGRVYKSSFKSLRRRIHVAIQVRRRQFRFYLNGKRLAMIPFKGKVTSVGFFVSGKYAELITDIRVAKYAQKEANPLPEKLGISVKVIHKGMKLTIPERVLFDFNKFILKPEAKKALSVVADLIRENPANKVIITGYTDNVGSDEYNLRLSLQRAQSVADYLIYVEKLPPAVFYIEGKGKTNPVSNNNTKEGRAKNRRVEIKIIKKQK